MIEVNELYKHYFIHGKKYSILENINFQVPKGHHLALIGRNGAGKSTLIRMLGKVELPSSGYIHHKMSVSWPLGFSGGFQGSLTGIDNIRFIARIYDTKFDDLYEYVDDFSELGAHLYKPVKTYSSGMRARLAFALSIAIDFDCYLIDEVMLVGDQRFHSKCMEALFDRSQNKALIVASHELGLLAQTCDSALIVENKGVRYFGNIHEAIEVYSRSM